MHENTKSTTLVVRGRQMLAVVEVGVVVSPDAPFDGAERFVRRAQKRSGNEGWFAVRLHCTPHPL